MNSKIEEKNKNASTIVAVASSTGGPKALQTVIPALPANLDAAVVIVQHMPRGFTFSLAQRLNDISPIVVKEAKDGELLCNGVVYIAPGGEHIEVVQRNGKHYINFNGSEPIGGLKPCANIMYESLSKCDFKKFVCVVLTGMGSDGTKGIRCMSDNATIKSRMTVLAQDRTSCVVYGMPKAVAVEGLADEIVTLNEMSEIIITKVGVS